MDSMAVSFFGINFIVYCVLGFTANIKTTGGKLYMTNILKLLGSCFGQL